jgi:hypothetical protein
MRTNKASITLPRSSRTLGSLWIVYGVLRVLSGAWVVVYSGTLTVMWGALLSRVPNPFAWMTLFHVALAVIVALDVIACIISILAGIALMQGSPSARNWGLVAAFFGLTNGPLGIALGAFTVAVLLPHAVPAAYTSDVATAA